MKDPGSISWSESGREVACIWIYDITGKSPKQAQEYWLFFHDVLFFSAAHENLERCQFGSHTEWKQMFKWLFSLATAPTSEKTLLVSQLAPPLWTPKLDVISLDNSKNTSSYYGVADMF